MTKEEVLLLTDSETIWKQMQANLKFKQDKDVWRRFLDLMKEENKQRIENLGIEYSPNAFYDNDRELDGENWDKNWRKVE